MSATPVVIPYEKQAEELTGRSCGAACLAMAYRSFGKEVAQTEIWPAISKENRFGTVSSTTHLMAQDALNRGFRAIAFQARHPLHVLRICRGLGIRAILNHRVNRDSAAGHYSVLVDIDNQSVVLHDPLLGAARRLSHPELLELWTQQIPNSEIAGSVMIAIGAAADSPGSPAPTCEFCGTSVPASVECRRCGKPMSLQPPAVLGCVKRDCIARMWKWVCCPACDYVFTLGGEGAAEAPADGAQSPAETPVPAPEASAAPVPAFDIAHLFSTIDQFMNKVLAIPAAAAHPDIKQQVALMAARKEELKLAHAQELANRTAILGKIEAAKEKVRLDREAAAKEAEAMNAPQPPLDGVALGKALLKNLGLK